MKLIEDYIIERKNESKELLKKSIECKNIILHLNKIKKCPIILDESGKLFTEDFSLIDDYSFFTDYRTGIFQKPYKTKLKDILDFKLKDTSFSIWPIFYFDIKKGKDIFSGEGVVNVGSVFDYNIHWSDTGESGMYPSRIWKREISHSKNEAEIMSYLLKNKMPHDLVMKYSEDVNEIRKIFQEGKYDHSYGGIKLEGGEII